MAMPTDKASAADSVTSAVPTMAPAKTTPTAMPSGMLCNVTANANMVVFFKRDFSPSGSSVSMCRCGITVSNSSKKPMPAKKPMAAGHHGCAEVAALISMLGISRDHTEAANMTPEANPNSNLLSDSCSFSFSKKTMAAPKVVPANGISSPMAMYSCVFIE